VTYGLRRQKKPTRYTGEGVQFFRFFKVFPPTWHPLAGKIPSTRAAQTSTFEHLPERDAGRTRVNVSLKRNRCNGSGRNCRNLQVKDEVVKALFLYAVVEANCGRQRKIIQLFKFVTEIQLKHLRQKFRNSGRMRKSENVTSETPISSKSNR
jgi:hypothetical protein